MQNINKIKVIGTSNKSTNSLIGGMYKETSYGLTDNGAKTFIRSGSGLLDFYAQAGAMRDNTDKALELFKKALSEDAEKAIRILFYLRDVRGGQGERELFRISLQWLGENYPEFFEKIIGFVPEYGRWDDMFFENETCFSLIKEQLVKDLDSEKPSLLAKWLPTANASSLSTRTKAKLFFTKLGMNQVEYRKKVRQIRKKIKAVEELMSSQKWGEVNYSTVPSRASKIYRNAFKKHDETRYDEFINKAVKGEVKMNASTLYPYEIYDSVIRDSSNKTADALWKNLPDYTRGSNALVVADVSGSMMGRPMSVSVSLSLYFAEKNQGQFKDHFITFSGNPRLQKVTGTTLRQRMMSIERAEWGMNTDIQKVFNLILTTAIQNNVIESEMPETIYIISDMEFDRCVEGTTNHESIKRKYEQAGYKIPTIVYWNVNASGSNLPVQKGKNGVSLVSGFSPSIFELVVEGKTPEQTMFDVINSERYSKIKL